jgi:imidazolonepropionase-like amidohydrolase
MLKINDLIVAVGALVLSSCATTNRQPSRAPGSPPREDLYFGFTLIDPAAGAVTENAWMVVRAGHIAATGSGRRPNAPYRSKLDASGFFAMPGLIDAHAHLVTGPFSVWMKDGAPRVEMIAGEKFTRFNALIALASGVTTLRNPGGSTEAASHYDTMQARGEWIGPEALHAGAIMQPLPLTGESFAHPATQREWDAEATRQANAGMTYFKLYHDLTEAEVGEGARAALAHGLIPIAHLDDVSWTRAAQMGVRQFEHAQPFSRDLLPGKERAAFTIDPYARYTYRWFELVDLDGPEVAEMIKTLRDRQSVVTLTLMASEVVFNVRDLSQIFPPEELALYQPQSLASARANYTALGAVWTPEDAARAHAVWPKVLRFARQLHDAGIRMMIGTDSTGGTPFLARELGHHVAAGIPPMEVLRMVTSGNAEAMGLKDTGRIAPGMEADLVFLRADPLLNMRNVRDVAFTVSNGVRYDPADLIEKAKEFAK